MVRAEFNEAVFGSCRIELKKHSGSVKDGDAMDCTGRGGGSSPSGVVVQSLIQSLKIWQSSC